MRFSLKSLFAAILATCVSCGVLFGMPVIVSVVIFSIFIALVPPAVIAAIVYGKGVTRAFAIGVLCTGGMIPTLYFFMFAGAAVMDWDSIDGETVSVVKYYMASMIILMGLSGLIGVGTRAMCLWMNDPDESAVVPANHEYAVLHRRVAIQTSDDGATTLSNPPHEEDRLP